MKLLSSFMLLVKFTKTLVWTMQYTCSYIHVPYRKKFSLVQIFSEKHPDSSEEIFAVFIFRGTRDALTTLLPVDETSSDCLLRVCWYFVQ